MAAFNISRLLFSKGARYLILRSDWLLQRGPDFPVSARDHGNASVISSVFVLREREREEK